MIQKDIQTTKDSGSDAPTCSPRSETPETDAEAFPDYERGGDVVLAEFARKLESERNEAREQWEKHASESCDLRARMRQISSDVKRGQAAASQAASYIMRAENLIQENV